WPHAAAQCPAHSWVLPYGSRQYAPAWGGSNGQGRGEAASRRLQTKGRDQRGDVARREELVGHGRDLLVFVDPLNVVAGQQRPTHGVEGGRERDERVAVVPVADGDAARRRGDATSPTRTDQLVEPLVHAEAEFRQLDLRVLGLPSLGLNRLGDDEGVDV